MLPLTSYWMGRNEKYPYLLTDQIKTNAKETVKRINMLVALYENEAQSSITDWASGWRPAIVNDVTSNSAKGSKHITAEAGDVRDVNRKFARWCLDNLQHLEYIGLWMEDCRWTPTWVHLQIVPPKSNKRVYIPSAKPPLVEYP